MQARYYIRLDWLYLSQLRIPSDGEHCIRRMMSATNHSRSSVNYIVFGLDGPGYSSIRSFRMQDVQWTETHIQSSERCFSKAITANK